MAHLLVLVGYGVMIEQSAGDLGHNLYGIIKTVFDLSYYSDTFMYIQSVPNESRGKHHGSSLYETWS